LSWKLDECEPREEGKAGLRPPGEDDDLFRKRQGEFAATKDGDGAEAGGEGMDTGADPKVGRCRLTRIRTRVQSAYGFSA
jgi:hypothetical protein